MFITTILLFLGLIALRVVFLVMPGEENYNALIWGSLYQIIALWGAICGIYLSRQWGGFKSLMGRASLAFAFGLLAQSFGQTVYSYLFYTGGEVVYPSLGDVGFFGSVLFYIYGVLLLARASGIKVTLNSFINKIQALLIPLVLLSLSYWIFLSEYIIDLSQPIKTILDFGYPLGQAFYISVALLILLLSRKVLGGIMKAPIIYFIIALALQYLSDFTFLYQLNNGTYVAGGIVDFMYFISYFAMAISLIKLGEAYQKIRHT
jgi:hypothetical protein